MQIAVVRGGRLNFRVFLALLKDLGQRLVRFESFDEFLDVKPNIMVKTNKKQQK